MVDGFVKVTNTNDINYKFELNLTDYFGNVITGTYQMNLPYFDLSDEQTPMVKKIMNFKKTDSIKRNKIIGRITSKRKK